MKAEVHTVSSSSYLTVTTKKSTPTTKTTRDEQSQSTVNRTITSSTEATTWFQNKRNQSQSFKSNPKSKSNRIEIIEKIVIDQIWSAAYADFGFITDNTITHAQYVAYYNSDRRIVIGMRKLDGGYGSSTSSSSSSVFEKYVLPHPNPDPLHPSTKSPPLKRKYNSVIQGWDEHNYLTLAVDKEGYLHLAGNMHVTPLLYYRMTQLGNLSSMEYVPIMVDKHSEDQMTYPKFLYTPDKSLIFHYRYRAIGNGLEYYNIYNTTTKTWKRFLNTPLFGSKDMKRYAYQVGPYQGPGGNDNPGEEGYLDGWYHLIWMWRLNPGPERNHNISYAKSKDLKHWVTADYNDGTAAGGDDGYGQNETANRKSYLLPLPMDVKNSRKAVIDPVSSNNGGMINTQHRLGFDRKNRPIISYHKNDGNGRTQACVARYDLVAKSWKVSIVSSWNYTHILRGNHSSWIRLGTIQQYHRQDEDELDDDEEGENSKHRLLSSQSSSSSKELLALPYQHWKHGNGLLLFDEESLQPVTVVPTIPLRYPMDLYQIKTTSSSSEFSKSMVVRWLDDDPNRNRHNEIDTLPPDNKSIYYGLRWESLSHNKNTPRDEPWPPNSDLVLYRFKYN